MLGLNMTSKDLCFICKCNKVCKEIECKDCGSTQENSPSPTLFQCAQYGLLYQLKEHLEIKHADINTTDYCGATILHWACLNNHINIVKYLLNFGTININALGGDLRSTPIYWATRRNHVFVVALLLEYGADPNIPDINGVSTFYLSVQCEQAPLSAFLISFGCNVDTLCTDGSHMTPLMWICKYRYNVSMVRTLLGLRASVSMKDIDGNTALHHAAIKNNDKVALELLMHDADPNVENSEGKKPVEVSSQDPPSYCTILLRDVQEYKTRQQSFPYKIFQRNARIIVFLIPWIFIPSLWIIAVKTSYQSFVISSGVLLMACISLLSSTGVCLQTGKKNMSPLMFGINTASVFWIAVVYYSSLLPYASITEFIVFSISVSCLVSCLIMTARTDPGSIRTTYNERLDNIRCLVQSHSKTETKLCCTCLIQQPLRSKHCAETNYCCAKFDHYCPFVNNVVGANNHHFFFGFLFFAVISILQYLYMFLLFVEGNMIFDYDKGIAHGIWLLFNSHAITTWTTILAFFHIWWISGLLAFQVYLLCRGLTTNEYFTQPHTTQVYDSPYSRGPYLNFVDMFGLHRFGLPGIHVDWTEIYTMSEYNYIRTEGASNRSNNIVL